MRDRFVCNLQAMLVLFWSQNSFSHVLSVQLPRIILIVLIRSTFSRSAQPDTVKVVRDVKTSVQSDQCRAEKVRRGLHVPRPDHREAGPKRLLEDPSYERVTKHYRGKGDQKKLVEERQRVQPWWKPGPGGNYVFTVRVRAKPIEFAPGKNAISFKSTSELPEIIDEVIRMVGAGELDHHFQAKPRPKKTEKTSGKGKKGS
jgi:hypothetical protein